MFACSATNPHVLEHGLLEARQLHLEGVGPRRQRVEDVGAVLVGDGRERPVRLLVDERDRGAGNDAALRIGHRALQAGSILRVSSGARQEHAEGYEGQPPVEKHGIFS